MSLRSRLSLRNGLPLRFRLRLPII